MLRHTHLQHAAAVLERVVRGEIPADDALRERFAQHRNAGSRDRATITALLYGVLRNYFALRAALGENASALELCAAHALRSGMTQALPALEGIAPEALAARLTQAAPPDDAARHNLPSWLWQALQAEYGSAAAALAQALNAEGTVDLRVNTLKTTREQAAEALRAESIESDAIEGLDAGLRLRKRAALQNTRVLRDGWIEPQDAGSQRLALFVAPAAGETVVDFCAGAGGKTLALGALMRNRGALHALDTSRGRLARFEPRLARSGLSIVQAQVLRNERDTRLRDLVERADAVLVDAPCSGTGTLRRNPELRLRPLDLDAQVATQRSILDAAARLVRPGGRLVYATCSVLKAENPGVVTAFLESHPDFRQAGELILLPHRDGTDGFYAARLARS